MIGYMAGMVLIAVALVLLVGIAALLTGDDERHVRAERHGPYTPRHAAWLPVPLPYFPIDDRALISHVHTSLPAAAWRAPVMGQPIPSKVLETPSLFLTSKVPELAGRAA